MQKRVSVVTFVTIVLVMLGITWTALGQDDTVYEAQFVSNEGMHLTIYGNGFALVRDTRTFDLQSGMNRVRFANVPQLLRQDSVAFTSSNGAVYVAEQFLATAAPTFSLGLLVYENIGQEVSVTLNDEDSTTYSGKLLSTDGYNLVIQQADGSLVTVAQDTVRKYRLPQLDAERLAQPELSLLVHSDDAGPQTLTITYITEGLSWQNASYNMHLAADNESLTLNGWLTVNDFTSATFEKAQITLAYGDFDRLQFVSHEMEFAAMPTSTPPGTATPSAYGGGTPGMAQPANLLLDIARPVTLPAGQATTIEFLAGATTAARNVYIYDASPRVYGYSGFITNPDYGLTGGTTVQNFLEFSTESDGGLGMALPAGTLRIYQENESGASLLIGQTQLAFTPEGEVVQVFLDNAADLTGERVQTDFQTLSSEAIQESYELHLTNTGDKDLTVTVPERMTRSARWEILGASAPYEQPDEFGIEFRVDVPAGSTVTISYTVLYTQ